MTLRRLVLGAAVVAASAAGLATALAALAWQTLAARDGEWSYRARVDIAGRVVERDVGVALLARLVSHPLAARLIDGRSVVTAHGRWRLQPPATAACGRTARRAASPCPRSGRSR